MKLRHFLFIGWVTIAFCGVVAYSKTCEEQGGKWVQDGWYYVMQTIGNITYPQQYPNYICVKEKK